MYMAISKQSIFLENLYFSSIAPSPQTVGVVAYTRAHPTEIASPHHLFQDLATASSQAPLQFCREFKSYEKAIWYRKYRDSAVTTWLLLDDDTGSSHILTEVVKRHVLLHELDNMLKHWFQGFLFCFVFMMFILYFKSRSKLHLSPYFPSCLDAELSSEFGRALRAPGESSSAQPAPELGSFSHMALLSPRSSVQHTDLLLAMTLPQNNAHNFTQ